MTNAQLTVLEGARHQFDQVFLLPEAKTRLIGRSSVCHFRVDDPLCSSLHMMITSKDGRFYLTDLLAANGVFVDGKIVDEHLLEEGQKIQIVKTILEFSLWLKSEPNKNYLTGEETALSEPLIEEAPEQSNIKNTKETPLGRKIKDIKDLNVLRLAIRHELLTHNQIKEIHDRAEGKPLCDILTEEKLLSSQKINELLVEHRYNKIAHKDIILGKLAIYYEMVLDKDVEKCLELQKQAYEDNKKIPRLSEMMVEKKYLTVKQNNKLVKILAQRRYG